MFQKLDDVVLKHKELTEMLMDPEVVSDPKKIMEYNKALNSIDEVVQKYTYYKNRKEEMKLHAKKTCGRHLTDNRYNGRYHHQNRK